MYRKNQLDLIKFFGEDLSVQKIVQSFYGLNYLEFLVFVTLYRHDAVETETISKYFKHSWPINKINGALKKLVDLDLAKRIRKGNYNEKNEKVTGFRYTYEINDLSKIKSEIITSIENWLAYLKIELDSFDISIARLDIEDYVKKRDKKERIRQKWFDS